MDQSTTDALNSFSLPVRLWFEEAFRNPTPPQTQGWPPIQRGEHTLILAPTGSGKTLAAFLWGIDALYRTLASAERLAPKGVHLLYVSPLKALNNDIERNLRVPLAGIRDAAVRLGQELPELQVAVRTGDTPSHVRAAMLKKPPHILITTPESLYLMLTSPRAREMFRTVRTVIVDEIHTLAGNKRGVHLSLSLERLEHLADQRVQRIGLSATIKPLDEVARFLGGQEPPPADSYESFVPRPVTVVHAIYKKTMDLNVITVVDDFRDLPGDTIWASLIPRVLNDIRTHRSTLIFANNRRLAERSADRLNAQLAAEESEEYPPGSTEVLAPGGHSRDKGIFAIGAEGPIRAHHGSMSKAARRQMEQDLKDGRLPALVGTSSLELGIDIGSIDLVVQLQSPKSVAQGLQRVGRSGHLVGETSVGHIYPTFREDLVEAAAIARGMMDGDVEPTYTPQNPLDVLAQQIVAMVAVENWPVPELFRLVKHAYAYRDLTLATFESVLEMLSGKFADIGQRDLRARISWDRVNNQLASLPGSRLLAMMNAGTISDTGAFGVYLEDRKTRLGELDEEFVYETRVGDAFLFGSKVWRVLDIEDDRIVVGDAAGSVPRMPFWNGDYPWRPYELGIRIGKFRREVAERIAAGTPTEEIEAWLRQEHALDENSARNLVAHLQRQLDAVGMLSSDKSIVVESFQDAVGEPRIVVHSPFGGRVNGAWALALTSAIRERTGIQPETQTNDDGILFRFPQLSGELPIDLIRQMSAAEARERILNELPHSALFGAHFRMNAARALLLPKARGQKRTPFWLQRLKAKDLLATVIRLHDFPLVAETYRDCLRDVLDLTHLEQVLGQVERGEIRLTTIETAAPSPVAAGLLYQFISVYMYEWDVPKAERQMQALALRGELLDDLLGERVVLADLLRPEVIAEVADELQHLAPGYQARSVEELMLILDELGDLTEAEITARSAGDGGAWRQQLADQGRIVPVEIAGDVRWVPVERADEYRALDSHAERIITRRLFTSGPVTSESLRARYPLEREHLEEILSRLTAARRVVRGQFSTDCDVDEFIDSRNLEQIRRRTLAALRKLVQAVSLSHYADFLTRWQHVHPSTQLSGVEGIRTVLEQLRGSVLAEPVWEKEVLPARVSGYTPGELSSLVASGNPVWVASGTRLYSFSRGEGALFLGPPNAAGLAPNAQRVYDWLKAEGASFAAEMEAGLGLKRDALREGLAELVTRGLVTNDSLDVLRELFGSVRHTTGPSTTALESELAARLGAMDLPPRPLSRSRYNHAKRRVVRRMGSTPPARPQARWSLLHRTSILGPEVSEEERAVKLARVWLARYGVLARDCLEREDRSGDWALIYPVLQRMEMRGEIRRGYFVTGLAGIQFALPKAVEELRQPPAKVMVVLNATDPANIYASGTGPIRLTRVPSTHLVFSRGELVLVAEDSGERITTSPDISDDLGRRALETYLARPGAPRHTVIKEWNASPVLGSPLEPTLQALGFHRVPSGLEK